MYLLLSTFYAEKMSNRRSCLNLPPSFENPSWKTVKSPSILLQIEKKSSENSGKSSKLSKFCRQILKIQKTLSNRRCCPNFTKSQFCQQATKIQKILSNHRSQVFYRSYSRKRGANVILDFTTIKMHVISTCFI